MPNLALRKFFDKLDEQGYAITYDDVRLRTRHSDIVPPETSLETQFSRRIRLKIPIVSTAMDTVTESRMAIAMAEAGGIGVIHRGRGLSPQQQAKEVGRVKHRLHGKIETPITVSPNSTVASVLQRCEEKGYAFRTFPVVDADGKLLGLVSGSDFEFCDRSSRTIREIMTPTRKLTTAPAAISAKEAYEYLRSEKKKFLPLMGKGRKLAGVFLYTDLKRIFTDSQSSHNVDERGQLKVAAAVGAGEGAFERAPLLARRNCDAFVVDTAQGDSGNVMRTVDKLKSNYPHIDVIAGNVSSGEGARSLFNAGVDGLLVGQGPGSICTTRVIAGVGVPQVTAVYESAQALEGTDVPVIADGGIKNSGDIAIALAIGASCVVLGQMLAGTDETPGDIAIVNGVPMKSYRGMGSQGAMRDNRSSRERYGQAKVELNKLVPEGVEGKVPYRGPVTPLLEQYVGGVRSSLGYLGARNIQEFRAAAELRRMSAAGLAESHPHDIVITTMPPNYRGRE